MQKAGVGAKPISAYICFGYKEFEISCKDNANREQNKMNLFIFYAEVPLASSKGGVFREFPINLWGKSAAWDKIRRYLCDVKK